MESLHEFPRLTKIRFEALESRRLMSVTLGEASHVSQATGTATTVAISAPAGDATATFAWQVGADGRIEPGSTTLADGTMVQLVPVTLEDGSQRMTFKIGDGSSVVVLPAPSSSPAPTPPPTPAPTPATRAESDMEMPLGTVVQADGKVLVATLVGVRPTSDPVGSSYGAFDRVALVRYLADGSIDSSFGNDGYSTYTLGEPVSSDYWPGAVAVDAEGGILVAHYNGINRFLADGTMDLSFGTNGTLVGSSIEQLKLAPDGKIVTISDEAVVRYNADGLVDASFTPYQLKVAGSKWSYADIEDVAVAADGSLYVVGEVRTSNEGPNAKMTNAFLAKLNADGTPDTSFADGGRYELATPGRKWEAFRGVSVLADGKVQIVGGYDMLEPDVYPVPHGALLARFNADGTPDASYGTGGIVDVPGVTINTVRGILVLDDGRLVTSTYGRSEAAVLVADADGSDAHLVTQPITLATNNASAETLTYAPTLAPDGTIVVAVGIADTFPAGARAAAETYWARIDLDGGPTAPPVPTAPVVDADEEATPPVAETPEPAPAAEPEVDPQGEPIAAAEALPARVRTPFWFEIADASKDDLLAPPSDDVLA